MSKEPSPACQFTTAQYHAFMLFWEKKDTLWQLATGIGIYSSLINFLTGKKSWSCLFNSDYNYLRKYKMLYIPGFQAVCRCRRRRQGWKWIEKRRKSARTWTSLGSSPSQEHFWTSLSRINEDIIKR